MDGVYEGDLIKRTESYIFYLTRGTLIIYSIAQEESTQVGKVELEDYVHTSWSFYYTNQEMYLSADGKTVTLVLPGVCYQTGAVGQMIWLLNLDVSDPKNVTKISEFYVQGAYQSSRLVDGKLLLMSRFTPDDDLDYGTPETFVPRVGTELDELDPIAADKIQLPTQMTSGSYTVVTMLDSDTLELVDAGAFLSCSTEIYVSQERIYASRSYAMVEENGNFRYSTPMTEISCMGYGPQGLKMLGTFQVEGTVQNQYSMDEYNGIFRVVTTVNQIGYWIGGQTVDVMATPGSSANLTCFYVDTWEEAGKLEHFAPNGESVQSVRFEENYAYVCTAVLMSDPVFFIDMTDLSNITAKDTGTITGYSSSLVQLGDGLLLGIGYGEQWELKVEIYRETDDGVVSVCAYSGSEWFASDYKAYYIDRENRYFGIPTAEGYVLLHFNGTALVELANVPFKFIQLNQARGVVIDQWLYVCADEMVVQQLTKVNEQ